MYHSEHQSSKFSFSVPVINFIWFLKLENGPETVQKSFKLGAEEMISGVRMLKTGISQYHAPALFNVSQGEVSRLWNFHVNHGDASQRHGSGRSKATNQHQDQFLLIQVWCQQFQNATFLNNELRNRTGVRIFTQTVRNSFYEVRLNARRPAICVPLTSQHMQDRLNSARCQLDILWLDARAYHWWVQILSGPLTNVSWYGECQWRFHVVIPIFTLKAPFTTAAV